MLLISCALKPKLFSFVDGFWGDARLSSMRVTVVRHWRRASDVRFVTKAHRGVQCMCRVGCGYSWQAFCQVPTCFCPEPSQQPLDSPVPLRWRPHILPEFDEARGRKMDP